MSRKYYPYYFIAVISIVAAIFGYAFYPQQSLLMYVCSTVGRFLVMCALWQLIGLINRWLEKRFPIDQQPAMQMVLQVIVTLVLLSPVFIISYFAITRPVLNQYNAHQMLPLMMVAFLFAILMLTFGYYAFDLFIKYRQSVQEKSKLALEAAQLEKERTMMRYHHLKNQVNPHFLFNTLTSLDGLIQVNPALASDFVRHLSKVYRYVLEHKENEVVSLETEVNFIQHYISLLQIRYKEALDIQLTISGAGMEKGIVMVTMQMLIDNAIKHNSLHVAQPLQICISDQGDCLHIRNNKQLRKQIEVSTGHGLKQLCELYAFLTEKPVVVNDTGSSFEVRLPLL